MQARQAVLAAILLGGAVAQAGAAPLISLPLRAVLQSKDAVGTVRWRYRHYRDFFWNGRGHSDPSDSNSAMRPLNSTTPGTSAEIFGPQLRRRGGWVDPPPAR